jgi:hypothetical protein
VDKFGACTTDGNQKTFEKEKTDVPKNQGSATGRKGEKKCLSISVKLPTHIHHNFGMESYVLFRAQL